MKRIVLFLVTNIAVLLVLSIIMQVFGLGQFLTAEGIDFVSLLVFSAVIGFGGAIISLLISKWMAKTSTGARVIDGSEGTNEYWLVETVRKLADKAQIGMPEGAIFEGAPSSPAC
jgi:heat shock protein HtpX